MNHTLLLLLLFCSWFCCFCFYFVSLIFKETKYTLPILYQKQANKRKRNKGKINIVLRSDNCPSPSFEACMMTDATKILQFHTSFNSLDLHSRPRSEEKKRSFVLNSRNFLNRNGWSVACCLACWFVGACTLFV